MKRIATWKLVALGTAAVAAAAVLVFNQILVAQARGIDANLDQVADQLEQSNETVGSILGKAGPAPKIDEQVAKIELLLAEIDETSARVNEALEASAESLGELAALTRHEVDASTGMESSLAAASVQTARLSSIVGGIIPVSRATRAEIARVDRGSAAAARSLRSITGKLTRYGLPAAR